MAILIFIGNNWNTNCFNSWWFISIRGIFKRIFYLFNIAETQFFLFYLNTAIGKEKIEFIFVGAVIVNNQVTFAVNNGHRIGNQLARFFTKLFQGAAIKSQIHQFLMGLFQFLQYLILFIKDYTQNGGNYFRKGKIIGHFQQG